MKKLCLCLLLCLCLCLSVTVLASAENETFPYVTTTIAPTMIQGGSAACNVLPQNMRAVINFVAVPAVRINFLAALIRHHLADVRLFRLNQFVQFVPIHKAFLQDSLEYLF